jgi:hypothetical protein
MALYPGAWGLDYEEVQGLCWLPYEGCGKKDELYEFSNGSRWKVTEVIEAGGFRAVLVKGKERTVLSFSGTNFDSIEDWLNNFMQGLVGISPYYARALSVARSYPADVVVGHSLGGGLASYCSIYLGKKAATINPAPLNINDISKIPIIIRNNLVINYAVVGEALYYMCLLTTPISPGIPITPTRPIGIGPIPAMTRVGRIIWVASNGSNMFKKHLLEHLAGFTQPVLLAPGTPNPYLPPKGPYLPEPDKPGYIPRIHVVKQGDWLSKIAITYYGDMNKWPIIYKRNIDQIGSNPDLIKPGQRLIIP